MKYSVVLATLFAGYVAAQSGTASAPAPTSTSGISACILQCITQAAQSAGCSSITDVTCVCTNDAFQSAAADCLQANCTAAEVQAALALQQETCSASTGSASGSATPTETETETSSAASATATAPASSSSVASVTSRASASSGSRTSSIAHSGSSVLSSPSSPAASATRSGNSAIALPTFNLATAGIWAAVALGGAAAAQLVL